MNRYICGYCGDDIESEKTTSSYIRHCPACDRIYGSLRVDEQKVKA